MSRVLLTGASAGIGRATARALLAAGWEVWGTSRDVCRLSDLPGIRAVAMDVSDSESIAGAFASALALAGGFDVLINNAGDGAFGPLEHLPLEVVRRQFATLVLGHIDLIQRVLPAMRERGSGIIVNVTSLAARLPIPFMAPYNAAKAAMSSLSASLDLELHGTGVRIIDFQPGDIRTGFNDAVFRGPGTGYDQPASQSWIAIEREMKAAPPPECVAREIVRLLTSPAPLATAGGFFQTRVAGPFASCVPRRWLLAAIRRYFGLTEAIYGLKSRRLNPP